MADLKNDIEKYLRGELSPAERHALEKRALSDPFLADALEGGESISAEHFSADLETLRTSLQDRIGNRKSVKVIPLWVWPARIAAGLLLLAAATFVIVDIVQRDTSRDTLAENEIEEAPAPPKDSSTQGPAPGIVTEEGTTEVGEAASGKTETTAPVDTKTESHEVDRRKIDSFLSQAESQEQAPAPPLVEKPSAKDVAGAPSQPAELPQQAPVIIAEESVRNDADADKADEKRLAYEPTPASSREAPSAARKKEAKVAAPAKIQADSTLLYRAKSKRIIHGQVTSADDGKGLPGVNVLIKGTNEGVVTNGEGYYQIAVNNADAGLMFSFIGMENQEVAPGATDEVNVALGADMTQLSEVVVVGYGSEKATEDVPETYEFAVPNGGRVAYKQYLETNLHYPELALQNEVEGRVTIQFTVETSGELSNFRVLKGIGYGCDEEVIKLIQRGPKWAPTKRDELPLRDKVKVRVRFRLPKK